MLKAPPTLPSPAAKVNSQRRVPRKEAKKRFAQMKKYVLAYCGREVR